MNKTDLRRRIAAFTYRALHWARHHVAPGLRSLLGLGLIVGGFFGFLPVLGFWMLPLGVAFISMDLPPTRHWTDRWMQRLASQMRGSDLPVAKPRGSDLPAANASPFRGQEAAPTEQKSSS